MQSGLGKTDKWILEFHTNDLNFRERKGHSNKKGSKRGS